MADTLDDLVSSFRTNAASAANTAQRMMSGAKDAVTQGYSQLKQTPGNVSTVNQALQSSGINISPPDAWDLGAGYRKAKANLTGLWRGYIAPNLPSFLK